MCERCQKLRFHVALKPVPKPASIELVWKPPGVNALNRISEGVTNHWTEVDWTGLAKTSEIS